MRYENVKMHLDRFQKETLIRAISARCKEDDNYKLAIDLEYLAEEIEEGDRDLRISEAEYEVTTAREKYWDFRDKMSSLTGIPACDLKPDDFPEEYRAEGGELLDAAESKEDALLKMLKEVEG